MAQKIVTRQTIERMLTNPNRKYRERVIGRALMVLLSNQTEDEKKDVSVKHSNGRGFASADGRSGTLTAMYYMKHGRLEDWQMEKWMKPGRLAKYHKQLNERAERNAVNQH